MDIFLHGLHLDGAFFGILLSFILFVLLVRASAGSFAVHFGDFVSEPSVAIKICRMKE